MCVGGSDGSGPGSEMTAGKERSVPTVGLNQRINEETDT